MTSNADDTKSASCTVTVNALAPKPIVLNYNSDNAEVRWGDLISDEGLWQIEAYEASTYLVLISNLGSEQAAGTYAWEDLDPTWTFVIDYTDNNKRIYFTDGSCTVTVDGDNITVSGSFTGEDGNTYEVTITYTAPPIPAFGPATFKLPASTKTIGESAFEGLPMTIVEIPDGCESIGKWAFKDCKSLTQIRIPRSVEEIDETAFDGCANVLVFGASPSAAKTFCDDNDSFTFVAESTDE